MFNFNSIENLSYCSSIVSEFTSLLYYTHIPSALITLLLGFFVFRKSSNLLLQSKNYYFDEKFCSKDAFEIKNDGKVINKIL